MARVVVAGIVSGAVLRVLLFLGARPLWYDEAGLGVNIGARGFRELLAPLDFGQAAPPLYLFATKSSTLVFGTNELALRLPALLAGLALLLLMPALSSRLKSERTTALVTWFVALSPLLVAYSNEVKQYEVEALVAVILTLAFLRVHERGARGDWVRLAGAGTLALWMSLSSVFVLGAIAFVMLAELRSTPADRPAKLVTLGTWGASAVMAWVVHIQHVAADPLMEVYWKTAYLQADLRALASRLPEVVGGLPSAALLHRDFFTPLPSWVRLAAIAGVVLMAMTGVVRVARDHGWRLLVLLAGPVALAFVAFLVRQYPFSARLLTFYAPFLLLLVAHGLSAITLRWPQPAVAMAAGLVLTPALFHAAVDYRDPTRSRPDEGSAIGRILSQRTPGEPIYVSGSAVPPWIFYSTNWDAPDRARIRMAHDAWFRAMTERPLDAGQASPGRSYQWQGYQELYSAPNGITYEFAPHWPRPVDPRWSPAEARRIVNVARPCAWLLIREMEGREGAELFLNLQLAGAAQRDVVRGRESSARRVCFGPGRGIRDMSAGQVSTPLP